MHLLQKIFGSRNDRLLKKYQKTVLEINKLEVRMTALPDEDLQKRTAQLKTRYSQGESLESLLPEAFAVCREAARRVLGMRHFDVQLIGAMALHDGKIAEMGTGEGKTLTATLAIYLNALAGKGVHIVTVNDYLAKRDAAEMGKIFGWLGLTTGVNLADMSPDEKKQAYAADITYGTNNEYGFDYLRDNMVYSPSDRVQRGLNYAIVDEVDSILIDEARTPLVISGQADGDITLFNKMNAVPPLLTLQVSSEDSLGREVVAIPGDYTIDEKNQLVLLTETGHEKAERILRKIGLLPEGSSLYDPTHIVLIHHLNAALKAHALYQKDKHYVVLGTEIVIVDEFTGRMMPGRRWADGLHQAVEAKEAVTIQQDTQTLASITFQNFFKMYAKLSGMTGTADTEAYEFQSIYNLETVVVPPNRPSKRTDYQDRVYKTLAEKYRAIIEDVQQCYELGQPVLIGTTSIENSERLSALLKKAKLPHHVLNAKNHEREAEIIAQAGKPKAITIATNMAGRGTDIVLGGSKPTPTDWITASVSTDKWEALHEEVIKSGGLHIIGTERHESRRIDNQLRGRAGRQGDLGTSRFYLSFEDPLIRIFSTSRVQSMLDRLKLPENTPIEAGLVSRTVESAQRKVEAHHFEIRKELLEYDNVANDQRTVMYEQRNDVLENAGTGIPLSLRHSVLTKVFRNYIPEDSIDEQWLVEDLDAVLLSEWRIEANLKKHLESNPNATDNDLLGELLALADSIYAQKLDVVGNELFNHYERLVMLQAIDTHWRGHLSGLDGLRDGINLRGYAQKDPKQEYKREAFQMFGAMLDLIAEEAVKVILTTQVKSPEAIEKAEQELSQAQVKNVRYEHASYSPTVDEEDAFAVNEEPVAKVKLQPVVNSGPKVGRNEVCPCGSGKKYKQCHGK